MHTGSWKRWRRKIGRKGNKHTASYSHGESAWSESADSPVFFEKPRGRPDREGASFVTNLTGSPRRSCVQRKAKEHARWTLGADACAFSLETGCPHNQNNSGNSQTRRVTNTLIKQNSVTSQPGLRLSCVYTRWVGIKRKEFNKLFSHYPYIYIYIYLFILKK